ncbi:MAG: glycoside hydrolase family 3 C-terminal domain-containing protein [Clostridiales bacterium]|nr:glycoside hydrolase family 3 C-terminal domain-containing protein [Clostridiales bacterium]
MHTYEKENLNRLRAGLAECTVLLKKDGRFPLTSPCKIAAYGSGVRHTIKGGTGSGEVNSRFFVTVEQGLTDAGFTITTGKWLAAYDELRTQAKEQFIKDIRKKAKKQHTLAVLLGMGAVIPEPEYDLPLDGEGDTAIYVLARTTGEGNDRKIVPGDFLLTHTEQRDILTLNQKYKNFMLVLNVGGPVDVSPVQDVKNILLLSQLGVETGAALADILLGKTNPGGKLTATWARAENYPDIGSFGDINDTFYKEGIYVGYRWFDAAGRKALYSFGFGLSYTEFSTSDIRTAIDGKKVTVTAIVTNTGKYPGKETLQVYLSCPQGKLDKPVKELAAFCKTAELAPGQSQEITASFDLSDFASYDEKTASYILEAGNYIVLCGTSADQAVAAAALTLDQTVITRRVKPLPGDPGFTDWKPAIRDKTYDVPVFPVDAAAFVAETVSYERIRTVDKIIQDMDEEELCRMNMGAFDPKGGLSGMIGNAGTHVAGAAGETTDVFKNRGIPNIVMADGPAGLRISARYYRDKKGLHSFGPAIPATLLDFMPKLLQMFLGGNPKPPKGAILQEQYCTAIPVGTAIAQSFNLEFAETCGDIVGSEMERFGVNLWLAPALNIHRTALCGRNFEYYSEDPVISGRFAAAVIRGVQSHPGRGVTLKHYAANNQETNRYFSNSHVSQRAMREIYLKGFRIAIRESSPKAVMTSYNLLNGVHTSENRELCTDILRSEFGFEGICMTDWVVRGLPRAKGSVYTVPDPAKVAAAGGDLFMPGSKADYRKLLKGLRAGTVSKRTLQENATRVYRMTKELS